MESSFNPAYMTNSTTAQTSKSAPKKDATRPSNSKNDAVSRQKKREADRRHQRAAREKTRSRIAYLEAMVQRLTINDPSGQVSSLMQRLAEVQSENDMLRKRMQDISLLAGFLNPPRGSPERTSRRELGSSDAEAQGSWSIDNEPRFSSDDLGLNVIETNIFDPIESSSRDLAQQSTVKTAPARVPKNVECSHMSAASATALLCPSDQQPIENLNIVGTHMPSSPDGSNPMSPPETDTECCCSSGIQYASPTTPSASLWRSADSILSSQALVGDIIKVPDVTLEEDIPVRAVLQGWESASMCPHFTSSWQILEGIDKLMFSSCDQKERIAILMTMHKLLEYHRDPSPFRLQRLPPWFRKRPAQSLAHTYATDFLAWPGLREKFIFSEHRYCSNIFWYLLRTCLKIQWAGTIEECYEFNHETGLFRIAPDFAECVGDIRNWAMTPEMFVRFPELRSDIPAVMYMQAPVSNKMQWQFATNGIGPLVKTSEPNSKQGYNTSLVEVPYKWPSNGLNYS
ncbi:hypothetical protein BU24DRAFT_112480 [Aaosphaeria arxii CBS 175.79]|uniref:BZIP domain-containing protein n=1 Tax=Aaosphaeria arxii CBS 175.79 TaxID=1450172 RepID=A0A6A5Y1F7_9PLEO|nr:uncharacterized protein BU24DRAFT_112480 [Aaosphaeria arxii CBS 175.79]KAF2019099.1 hypothetical protein BU24DRAFT_112480 [Aaosphaeria arxii CBS 175.79]